MKLPTTTYSEDEKITTFHTGRFHYTAEDNKVIVSKTGLTSLDIELIASYEFANNDDAVDNAYKMAFKQANY